MDRTLVVASLMIALLITAKSWMTEREYCVPCSMFVFLLILKPTSHLVSICSFSCLCKTTVTEDVVFHSVEGLSPSNILSNLTIGSRPPAEGSTTFAGDGFQYHLMGSALDENTIFEVNTKGKTIFLKNVRSTVHIQGWEYMAPTIYEAESARIHNAVSIYIRVFQASCTITQMNYPCFTDLDL